MSRCAALAGVTALLVWLTLGVPGVGAQSDDPASVVNAYAAALNAHDLNGALALFDATGSATDAHGQHFEGHDGLASFLLANGFAAPDASISTEYLQVVGNRALWTYRCSCASEPSDVRVVLNHNRIVVFFMSSAPPAPAPAANDAGRGGLVLALIALLATGAILMVRIRLERALRPAPRPAQGRLLAGLLRSRELKLKLKDHATR